MKTGIALASVLILGLYSIQGGAEVKTEADIYNETTYGLEIPLKAKRIEYKGEVFYLLHDGQGRNYIRYDAILEDNGNYVGTISKFNNELINIEKGNFEFEYEEWFNDKEFEDDDIELGIRLYGENADLSNITIDN